MVSDVLGVILDDVFLEGYPDMLEVSLHELLDQMLVRKGPSVEPLEHTVPRAVVGMVRIVDEIAMRVVVVLHPLGEKILVEFVYGLV